jgi:hypothetical protein
MERYDGSEQVHFHLSSDHRQMDTHRELLTAAQLVIKHLKKNGS